MPTATTLSSSFWVSSYAFGPMRFKGGVVEREKIAGGAFVYLLRHPKISAFPARSAPAPADGVWPGFGARRYLFNPACQFSTTVNGMSPCSAGAKKRKRLPSTV
jgi:hypothetical protein